MNDTRTRTSRNLADRIREAIDHSAYDSIKEFQQALEEVADDRNLRGASYSQFHRYLQGNQVPSLPLLREIAELAGVRPAWLVFGDGEPTASEEGVRRGGAAPDEFVSQPHGAIDEFIVRYSSDAFGWANEIDRTVGKALLMAVLGRVLGSCPDSDNATAEEIAKVAYLVRKIARYPAMLLLNGGLDDLSRGQAQDYLWSICLTMRTAIPGRNEGLSIEALTEGMILPEQASETEADAEEASLLVQLALTRFDGNATWLANAARVTPAAVRNWKAGRRTPSADSLNRIAAAVEWEFDDSALAKLLRRTADRRPEK